MAFDFLGIATAAKVVASAIDTVLLTWLGYYFNCWSSSVPSGTVNKGRRRNVTVSVGVDVV
jgi:hypothetical protein